MAPSHILPASRIRTCFRSRDARGNPSGACLSGFLFMRFKALFFAFNFLKRHPCVAEGVVEFEVHPGALLAVVHLGDPAFAALEEGVCQDDLVALPEDLDGVDGAVLFVEAHGEVAVGAGQLEAGFRGAQAADDTVDARVELLLREGLLGVDEDVAGQEGAHDLNVSALLPLPLQDLRGKDAAGAVLLQDCCNQFAALGLAEQAVYVHRSFPHPFWVRFALRSLSGLRGPAPSYRRIPAPANPPVAFMAPAFRPPGCIFAHRKAHSHKTT